MLHVTNGESAAEPLRFAFPLDEVLSWIDVLHEGPVPDLELDPLTELRARFVADSGWEPYGTAHTRLRQRNDSLLRAVRGEEDIVLWFEHDLFDQLQLLQLLSILAGIAPHSVTLINIRAFPGVEPFQGLGQLNATQLATLFPARQTVSPERFDTAHQAWKAFCAETPEAITELLSANTRSMPFLRNAILRLLQEYPGAADGLSRTERQILTAVAEKAGTREHIYAWSQQQEEAAFMGDITFFGRLYWLSESSVPALRRLENHVYALTDFGRELLDGHDDWINRNGIDKWIGGTHLTDGRWRWNDATYTVEHR
jgi:hypothetical protein